MGYQSIVEINLQNIEQLIFYDKNVQFILPEFRHFFDQWSLGQRIPALNTLAKRSVLDLLNSLNEDQIAKLEEYFKDTILVDKIDNRLVAHYKTSTNDENNEFCKFSGYRDFCLTRKGDQVSVTFWR